MHLHTEGVFNNGASDLKDIAEYLEAVFDIDLGKYHRAFLEIRMRKSDQTKFLKCTKRKISKANGKYRRLAVTPIKTIL